MCEEIRQAAAGLNPHADPQFAGRRSVENGVSTADFLASERGPQRNVLTWFEVILRSQGLGDSQGKTHGIIGGRHALADGQRMKIQMHLKYSKGSRQDLQR